MYEIRVHFETSHTRRRSTANPRLVAHRATLEKQNHVQRQTTTSRYLGSDVPVSAMLLTRFFFAVSMGITDVLGEGFEPIEAYESRKLARFAHDCLGLFGVCGSSECASAG